MNQLVSFFVPGNSATPAPGSSEPILRTKQDRSEGPFSSVLDRAERRTPDRKSSASKTASQRSSRSERSREDSAEVETRSRKRDRVEEKRKPEVDDGKSQVTNCSQEQKPNPDEPVVAAETTATEAVGDQTASTASGCASQANGGSATASNSATQGTPKLSSGGNVDGAITLPIGASDAANGDAPATTATATAPTQNASGSNLLDTVSPISVSDPSINSASAVANAAKISAQADASQDAIEGENAADALANGKVETLLSASSARAAEVLLAASADPALTEAGAANGETQIAAEQVLPEEARLVARAARRFRAEGEENVDGIGGAKSSMTMKNAIKTEEVAGMNQQILPGSAAAAVVTLPNLPSETRRAISEASASVPSGVDALQAASKTSPAPVRADAGGTEEVSSSQAASPLARVGELISREVRMFKRTGDDQVEVVLTPDTKTQISLRLQWREGQVEVQARCDFGDYGTLNNQWSQLQASMANHGVRLSHLSERTTTGFTEFFNNPNFAQQQSSGRERNSESFLARPETLAGITPEPKPGAATSVRRTNRLFDSWA